MLSQFVVSFILTSILWLYSGRSCRLSSDNMNFRLPCFLWSSAFFLAIPNCTPENNNDREREREIGKRGKERKIERVGYKGGRESNANSLKMVSDVANIILQYSHNLHGKKLAKLTLSICM